ncbi:YhgE/Pip family protein [Bacillus carboniphilus]|uniref:YhgE/Pip family protein n=1 Tax=Bacillus carboniphilus TaxID=86663 RepID=A0ABY9JTF6_9BACI|nr:YhgE/Pip family protein [Bacillus carboniphilus]WLR42664.1 YhgE/Pip family protein [Bacillus carboniphilus]
MFADPVEVKNDKVAPVPDYGTGFSPYFLSLGLFVGALTLSIVFPLREPVAVPSSPIAWFLSKFGVLAVVSLFQTVLVVSVMFLWTDIQVHSEPYFILFTFVSSLTYITLIQFLATVLDNPGRFIAILLLIFQLTTSAGTFPLELIPDFFQWFNPFLPMTYTVFGYKAVISTGDFSIMWQNMFVLFSYIAVFIFLTNVYFRWNFKRRFEIMAREEA